MGIFLKYVHIHGMLRATVRTGIRNWFNGQLGGLGSVKKHPK